METPIPPETAEQVDTVSAPKHPGEPDLVGSGLNPWLFVPLLYFMQAIPVTVVQEVSTIFYKDLGIGNQAITQWTSLISLPWSLQLLLGPLVDLNGAKRQWILGGQMLIALGLAAAAFALKLPHPFEITLVILGATAIVSALCNIATDGFYIITLSKQQQAKFVGVQSTSYRLGRLFGVGLLVLLAGKLAKGGMGQASAWCAVLLVGAVIYGLGHLINRRTVPKPAEDRPAADQGIGENQRNIVRTLSVIGLGLGGYFTLNALVRLGAHLLWVALDGQGAAPPHQPDLHGWRLPATSHLLGLTLPGVSAEIVQLAVSVGFGAVCLAAARRLIARTPMGDAFASFARQPGIGAIFLFILTYRFGEAMVTKMSPLFLKDSMLHGGLAIPNDQLGVIKGLFGVVGIVCGGLAGGYVVSRLGLRRAFLPLALCMHLPNLLYLMLAATHVPLAYVGIPGFGPTSFTLIGVDFADQFGYGFGFAAYMVYLMWVAQRGNYKTAHYAIGTGLGALCIAMAGVLSGKLQEWLGYPGFFTAVIFLSIPGLLTLFFIPLDDRGR